MAAGLGRVVRLVGLAAILVVAACGSGTADPSTTSTTAPPATTEPAPTSTTSTTAPTTTTGPAPPTTTLNPDILLPNPIDDPESLTAIDAPPPEVDLEAETWAEFLLVWEQIDAYWTWLYAHPDLAGEHLDRLFDPRGPASAEQGETFSSLANDGLRRIAESTFGRIVSFGCCPDPDDQMLTGRLPINLTTSLAADAVSYVAANGSAEFTVDGWPSRQFSVELRRDELGRWIVWSTE